MSALGAHKGPPLPEGTLSVSDVELSRIAVIGSGSWGTALANLLAEKEGIDVNLWAREEEVYKEIRDKHTNQVFLPDVQLAPALKPVSSPGI